ncbi:MAG TPA: hypothetical protein VEG34_09265 [Thermoanaerobaculia bacterium]|nr:hypothetical protein [Thermoanaerobaculia bacterium]
MTPAKRPAAPQGVAGRRILGNLLAEEDLATLVLDLPRARGGQLSRPALQAASGFATLLRVFAQDGDRLWTPAPVDPARLAEVPGLPRPILESGPLDQLPPVASLLAWCETPGTAAVRAQLPVPAEPASLEGLLYEVLWRLPVPPPVLVAAVHDRAFHLALARQLGQSLPGARLVSSLDELEVAAAGIPAWVVKSRFSAAGRDRHVERGAGSDSAGLPPETRSRVAGLLDRRGPLVFEPWLERTRDFGLAGLVVGGSLALISRHRQLVDRNGRFRGIELPLNTVDFPRLPEDERNVLQEVAHALAQAGFSGPFGIDGWRYRRPDGSRGSHLLGEINARLTFGLVARTLVDRLAQPLGFPERGRARLTFSRTAPSAAALPLLYPGEPEGSGGGGGAENEGAPGAWLQIFDTTGQPKKSAPPD